MLCGVVEGRECEVRCDGADEVGDFDFQVALVVVADMALGM